VPCSPTRPSLRTPRNLQLPPGRPRIEPWGRPRRVTPASGLARWPGGGSIGQAVAATQPAVERTEGNGRGCGKGFLQCPLAALAVTITDRPGASAFDSVKQILCTCGGPCAGGRCRPSHDAPPPAHWLLPTGRATRALVMGRSTHYISPVMGATPNTGAETDHLPDRRFGKTVFASRLGSSDGWPCRQETSVLGTLGALAAHWAFGVAGTCRRRNPLTKSPCCSRPGASTPRGPVSRCRPRVPPRC
jgi:hypothetical protein